MRPAPAPDHMFLRGIEVHGRHGVFDFERRAGQRFIIDVDWWLATEEAVASDRLDATLCYKRLHDSVCEIVVLEVTVHKASVVGFRYTNDRPLSVSKTQ